VLQRLIESATLSGRSQLQLERQKMTPEKWKQLKEETNFLEKAFLHLYRVFVLYPWKVFGLLLLMCMAIFVGEYNSLADARETAIGFVFSICVAPLFFFFGMKFILWILLRAGGIPAEYLRV
jgi:membrane glycosyltransferase